ncbi:MAG: anthranilate synthase component I family protein [Prevotellaceae bacterium]|jgi:anthranilate synthase component 1|nr:anthranilate synthase component I family protein [Prevotellaceae bacterium]
MNIKTNTRKMLADLQTPVGIYLKIRDLGTHSVLLESSDYHGGENSFSYIGFCPIGGFSVNKFNITETFPDGTETQIKITDKNTLPDAFNDYIKSYNISPLSCGEGQGERSGLGLFGYTSYEAVQYFEDVVFAAPATPPGDMPGMHYLLFKYIIAVNHFKDELIITENLLEGEASGIDDVVNILNNNNVAAYDFQAVGQEKSDITDEQFMAMVRGGKEHCYKGNVFQIVLSRRFSQAYKGDDFTLYRTLRSVNPSPYLYYFDFADFRIFGSSPEAHLVINKKQNKAYINPIAGTFRRTGDDEKDFLLAEKLQQDPKENAEHVMLVDLARNDLSRNTDNVVVETYKEVQYYSHVIHLVSSVSGRLREGSNAIKIFADTFPAGTLSGAPKIKAMQIIDKLEPHDRGPYGGCIGFIGFDGSFNQAITIRSFVSKNNTLYYQAGAGIVAKSEEKSELQEVNNKLGALKSAIDKASKNEVL